MDNDVIIASGPVIIEDGKVLLNKERRINGDIPSWFFPGGTYEESDGDVVTTCKREVKEEMGIDIKIIKQLKTTFTEENGRKVILHHFLASRIGEIKPGKTTVEWGWFMINNLPNDCAPNVYDIIKDLI